MNMKKAIFSFILLIGITYGTPADRIRQHAKKPQGVSLKFVQ